MQALEAQKLLIKTLKAFGFFTYNFDFSWSSNLKLNVYCGVVCISSFCIFMVNSISYTESTIDFLGDENKISSLCSFLEIAACQFNFWILIFCTLFTKKKQMHYFKTIVTIANDLENLPLGKDDIKRFHKFLNSRTKRVIIITVLYHSFIQAFYTFLLWDQDISHIVEIFNYLILSCYYIFVLTFLTNLVMTMQVYFNILHDNLQVFVSNPELYQDELIIVMKLHQQLSSSIQIFSESFGLMVLGAIVYISGNLTVESYFSFVTFHSDVLKQSMMYSVYSVLSLLWGFPFLFFLQYLGNGCENVQESIERTTKILRNLNGRDRLFEKFLLDYVDADYRFTANGLVYVDRSMIFMVN